MAAISGPHKIHRELAAPGEIPALLKSAVTAAEDRKFYRHNGIDYWGILRALKVDILHPSRFERILRPKNREFPNASRLKIEKKRQSVD